MHLALQELRRSERGRRFGLPPLPAGEALMPKAPPQAPALFEEGELADAPSPLVREAVDIYNAIAKRLNAKGLVWCEAKALTAKRRKRLQAVIPDYGGVRGWQKCLDEASRNPFLLGKEGRSAAHRNWRPDLDFFLQEKTVLRLLEGGYAPEDQGPERIHMPTVWKPPHQAAKPFVQTETLEERYAASIVSFRKHGFWDKANATEEKLAALQKRPAVLVPAPEVSALGMEPKPPVVRPQPIIRDVFDWNEIPEGDEP